MDWLNLPTLIVVFIIASILFSIIYSWVRSRRKGKSTFSCACGGNCKACGMHCSRRLFAARQVFRKNIK